MYITRFSFHCICICGCRESAKSGWFSLPKNTAVQTSEGFRSCSLVTIIRTKVKVRRSHSDLAQFVERNPMHGSRYDKKKNAMADNTHKIVRYKAQAFHPRSVTSCLSCSCAGEGGLITFEDELPVLLFLLFILRGLRHFATKLELNNEWALRIENPNSGIHFSHTQDHLGAEIHEQAIKNIATLHYLVVGMCRTRHKMTFESGFEKYSSEPRISRKSWNLGPRLGCGGWSLWKGHERYSENIDPGKYPEQEKNQLSKVH